MSATHFHPTPSRVDEQILREKRAAARSRLAPDGHGTSAMQATRNAGHWVADRSRDGARMAARTVRQHPIAMLGVGLGMAALIALLLERRRR